MRLCHAFPAAVLAASLIIASTPAFAGSICGTVRDASTSQPVPRATLFLFDYLDQYTGRYAVTGDNGAYCIHNVADGTYTLQVRVNDYLMATVPDVVVTGSPTGVDVDLPPGCALREPWPNPASNSVTFRLQSPPGATLVIDVFDVAGRRLYGWKGASSMTGERTIEWDLRDLDGSELQSGIYFVRLSAAGETAVRRFVRLH